MSDPFARAFKTDRAGTDLGLTRIHSSWTSNENINGVYIPVGLIIVGIAIMKSEWVPYAAAVAVALAAWKLMSNSK